MANDIISDGNKLLSGQRTAPKSDDGIKKANDAVASAKKALSNEAHSPVGSKGMDASYSQARTARTDSGSAPAPKPPAPKSPTTGDELAAKKTNVDQYVAAT